MAYQSGYRTTISKLLSPGANEVFVATPPVITEGRLFCDNGAQRERMSFSGVDGNKLTGLVRQLSTSGTATSQGNGETWIAGSSIIVVAMHDQIADVGGDNNFTGVNTFDNLQIPNFADATARDAAITSPNGRMLIKVGNVYQGYNESTAQWEAFDIGTPPPSASEANQGLTQLATVEQQGDQEENGSQGPLVVQAKNTVKTYYLYTPAFLTGGTGAEGDFAVWEAVTDGSFRITIDGTAYNIDAIDFTGVTDMDDVAAIIQTAIRAATGGEETVVRSTDKFIITSGSDRVTSAITVTTTSTGTVGTDISGAGASDWMDTDTGNGTVTNAVLTESLHENLALLLNAQGKVNPNFIDNGSILADGVEALVDKDTYLLGEDADAGDSVFVEDMVDSIGFNVNDGNGITQSNSFNVTTNAGVRITAKENLALRTVTKDASCTATTAYLRSDASSVIETATFVGNVATFSSILDANTTYQIIADSGGASYQRRNGGASFPIPRTNINYISGYANNSNNGTGVFNIGSIETAVVPGSIEPVGNIAANTRVSIPAFGSGTASNTLKLALRKYVDPFVNLGVRIETDNNGEPSGNLFDADAIATVIGFTLTTSLVDTTVTLAGSITIPLGEKVHIVLFAGIYGSEVVNGTNYYGVGYKIQDTTTRKYMKYDGADWALTANNSETNTHGVSLNTTQAVTSRRGFRFEITRPGTITTATKNATANPTTAYITDLAGNILSTATFATNTVTFNKKLDIGTYFLVADTGGASYNSRVSGSTTFPKTGTFCNITGGTNDGGLTVSTTLLRNFESISFDANLANNYMYVDSDLFTDKLLSLTDATYSYKLPTDLPRVLTESKSEGEYAIATTLGLNDNFAGLTPNVPMYIADTPGAISSTPGTNNYKIGKAIDASNLFIGTRQESKTINIARDYSVDTGVVTYTHNLGKIPTKITINGGIIGSDNVCFGSYDGLNQGCVYYTSAAEQSTTSILVGVAGGTVRQTGIIQNITNTTFDISWTRNSSGAITGRFNVIVSV